MKTLKISKKKIIRALYAGTKDILRYAELDQIREALDFFERRFKEEMNKEYYWFAVATAAVEAGRWGGDRRLARRAKLLNLTNACREALGEDLLAIPEGGLRNGLKYGYLAVQQPGELLFGFYKAGLLFEE